MNQVKVAVVQSSSVAGDTPATIKKVIQLINDCRQQQVEVAVFPEAFVGGYPKGTTFGVKLGVRTMEGREEYREYYDNAIAVPGPETELIGEAAAKAKMFVVIGVIEKEGGTLYCTALYFGPNGTLLGKHRKLMPTAAERLCWGFGDGSTIDIVDTPWGAMGAVICWENYMPLFRQAMYSQGIKLYCAPTADDRDTWLPTMQHIALEGRCFVLSACQFMKNDAVESTNEKDTVLRGGSLIIDPFGEVLAGPEFDTETILTADLDVRQQIRGKFDFDATGHYSRSDIFNLNVNVKPQQSVSRSDSMTDSTLNDKA